MYHAVISPPDTEEEVEWRHEAAAVLFAGTPGRQQPVLGCPACRVKLGEAAKAQEGEEPPPTLTSLSSPATLFS